MKIPKIFFEFSNLFYYASLRAETWGIQDTRNLGFGRMDVVVNGLIGAGIFGFHPEQS